MIIRVRRHEKPFTTIDNGTLRDSRLSFKARGLLTYLLSLPPETPLDRTEIAKNSPGGVAAVRSGLKELAEFGYLTYSREQTSKGLWKTEATVWECPPDRRLETDLRSDLGLSIVSAGRTEGWLSDGRKPATKNLKKLKQEERRGFHPEPEPLNDEQKEAFLREQRRPRRASSS